MLILVFNFSGIILSAWAFFAKRVNMAFMESLLNQDEFNKRIRDIANDPDYYLAIRNSKYKMKLAEKRWVIVFIIGTFSSLAAIFWLVT